jgi:hypothetical protein
MDKREFAAILNGREMGEEITGREIMQAKECGLVVVFGYSDDNTEFCGAINDEAACYGGRIIYLNRTGIFEGCEHDKYCKYVNAAREQCKTIEAIWGDGGDYSWTYKTDIPHATFEIMEDGEPFCRGIVFDIKDL